MINVVIPAYKCFEWLPSCLFSVAAQDHSDYTVCVIDDFSEDPLQVSFIKDVCEEKNWAFILNKERKGSMFNQFNAINLLAPKDGDAIAIVDGDDSLARPDALSVVQRYYDDGYMLTYGNYRNVPYNGLRSSAAEYSEDVKLKNKYRRCGQLLFNHLRTFSYDLYKELDPSKDFRFADGTWFQSCADTAIMIPCLELAGGNHKFINEKLYNYNCENPLSDWRTVKADIDKTNGYILNHLKRKKPLNGIHIR